MTAVFLPCPRVQCYTIRYHTHSIIYFGRVAVSLEAPEWLGGREPLRNVVHVDAEICRQRPWEVYYQYRGVDIDPTHRLEYVDLMCPSFLGVL